MDALLILIEFSENNGPYGKVVNILFIQGKYINFKNLLLRNLFSCTLESSYCFFFLYVIIMNWG